MSWLKHNWRAILARLPLPMLALAASWGVYSFAALYVPWPIAVIQAAAFELTYIGLAITRDLSAEQRRRATYISIGAVVVSVIYNAIDGLFARNPAWLIGLPWGYEIGGAVLHGAPLAIVAYLVADLLLHSQQRAPSRRPAQLRATLRRLARLLRAVRRDLAGLRAMLTQARAELAQAMTDAELARAGETAATANAAQTSERAARLEAEIAQLQRQVDQQAAVLAQADPELAQLRQTTAQQEQAIAQLKAELAQPIIVDTVDLLTIARRMEECGVTSRNRAQILGIKDATLRSRLKATNGQHAE